MISLNCHISPTAWVWIYLSGTTLTPTDFLVSCKSGWTWNPNFWYRHCYVSAYQLLSVREATSFEPHLVLLWLSCVLGKVRRGSDVIVSPTETRRKSREERSQIKTHMRTRTHITSRNSIKVSLGRKPCFVTSKHFHNSWTGDSSIEVRTKMSAL